MNPTFRLHPLFVVVAVVALAFVYQRRLQANEPRKDDLTATYVTSGSSPARKSLAYKPLARQPDTTAILLNWSRFPNVIKIVDTLCDESLDSVLSEIVVWNNSPSRLSKQDFSPTPCVREKLKIHNSPTNLYFQARFLACAESSTRFCFIQDDDYLVLPQILSALHEHALRTESSVHLLPPHEHLSSELRKIHTPTGIHTSFAWLGHGALLPRSQVVQYLDLMHILNATDEQMKMADNYYTILSNTYVVTWFDQGIELGGGQAFTVGTAGEERNRRHINRALEMLEAAVNSKETDLPYVKQTTSSSDVYRAACAQSVCQLETNIRMVSPEVQHEATRAVEMLDLELANMYHNSDFARFTYLNHPPSFAVDGKPHTAFRSFQTAKANDTITLETFSPRKEEVVLVFLVDKQTEPILGNAFFEMKSGDSWIATKQHLVCVDVDVDDIFTDEVQRAIPQLRECGVKMHALEPERAGASAYRARLSINLPFKWCIYEAWLRTP